MKTILEILQYGDTDIRYRTDLKLFNKPEAIPGLIASVSYSMMTSLWGGNEQDIIAIIRALSIADLSVSMNRKEMIKMMDQESGEFAKIIRQAHRELERNGGRMIQFTPFIKTGNTRS